MQIRSTTQPNTSRKAEPEKLGVPTNQKHTTRTSTSSSLPVHVVHDITQTCAEGIEE